MTSSGRWRSKRRRWRRTRSRWKEGTMRSWTGTWSDGKRRRTETRRKRMGGRGTRKRRRVASTTTTTDKKKWLFWIPRQEMHHRTFFAGDSSTMREQFSEQSTCMWNVWAGSRINIHESDSVHPRPHPRPANHPASLQSEWPVNCPILSYLLAVWPLLTLDEAYPNQINIEVLPSCEPGEADHLN
ncbi:unnamed protein product [Nesidiocoris tenuis]|uniref:Uncharacterized protein n=1 Tax=Nesidiocoris tenuis TaxID=355587 RepID=A0A6H5H581_9HEMI|nr:unnamed protein product [Nesidiocoris tenuis]